MKMDKEGGGGGEKKNSPGGAGRERGMTGGKKDRDEKMLECASKMSFEVICGQFVKAFFFFF